MIKIIKKITDILLITIIALLVCYLGLRMFNKVEIYNVKTGSMEDRIHAGDYIFIYKKDTYNIGDVVTFRVENGYITHRIIKIDNDTVTTKGDANNTEDEEISKDKIVGKVLFSGGMFNIVIRYKYALIGAVLSLYLITCFLKEEKEHTLKEEEENHL